MDHLNIKSRNLLLAHKDISCRLDRQKRYYSSTGGAIQPLSYEKGSLCSSFAGSEENFHLWFVGFSDAESSVSINPILKKDKVRISSFSFMFKVALPSYPKHVRYASSTSNAFTPISLHPLWVTGFVDAEGSFIIGVRKQKGCTGYRATALLTIHLHIKDLHLLYKIQSFFKVGRVHESKTSASFTVERFEDVINVIVPHFKKYPLESAKSIDFYLWSKCVEIMANKEHLVLSGLKRLVRFKSALNKGLPEYLSNNPCFSDIMERPVFKVSAEPLNPYWISGFSEGDASFYVTISEKSNQVRMFYAIKLNNRETPLVFKIQEFFKGKGYIVHDKNNMVQYSIVSIKVINETVIPTFDTYRFSGNKLSNYLVWKEILGMLNSKAHLTAEGLDKIRDFKSTLNIWKD
uniref:LAGLIDADG endonuclease n=1 Tax=Sclerotinia borealis TaxID=77105 RepID=A0A088CB17_9HELO|nr:LAGLIDADG endonuclease [Sclerotinia borealis]AHX83035.1 LAGLIDADG endonuclease [Sclerotinia borealis]